MESKGADASDAHRWELLRGLGKWSTVVIAAIVVGALLHSEAEGGSPNGRSGWVDGGGGWVDTRGGGGWLNAR